MRVFLILVRALAVLLGLFLVAISIADVCGLIPYSMQTPPLRERILPSVPIAVASLALLVPYRAITSAIMWRIVLSVLLLFSAYFVVIAVAGWRAYAVGEKTWHVIPASLVLLFVIAANLYAFFALTSNARSV